MINTANANPMVFRRFDASPTITIQSPQDNQTYSPDNTTLVFSLSKPNAEWTGPYDDSWFEPINCGDFGNKVVNATIYIDGQPSNLSIDVNSTLLEPFNYSVPLEGLADGNHTLQICLFCNGVEGMTWMAGYDMGYFDYYAYSQTIAFTVATPDSQAFMDGALIALFVVLVVVACLVALALYRRRK